MQEREINSLTHDGQVEATGSGEAIDDSGKARWREVLTEDDKSNSEKARSKIQGISNRKRKRRRSGGGKAEKEILRLRFWEDQG
jgi:hypothetical protein